MVAPQAPPRASTGTATSGSGRSARDSMVRAGADDEESGEAAVTDPERSTGWGLPGGDLPHDDRPAGPSPSSPPTGPPAPLPPSGWGGPASPTPSYGAPPPGWGGPQTGAPRPGVVPLRPLGLGELLDGAVGVVRRYPRPTLGLSFVVAVVSTLLTVGVLVLLPTVVVGADSSGGAELSAAEIGGAAVGALAAALVTGLAGIVLAGIITAVVGKAVLGQPLTTSQAWQAVRPLLARLVGLSLLVGLLLVGVLGAAVLVGVLAVVVLGDAGLAIAVPLGLAALVADVYLYVRLSLAAPALVLEKLAVREALRRSGVLVRGSSWRVLGVLVLTGLIAGAVGQVLQLPFVVLGGGTSIFTGGDVGLLALVLAQVGAGLAQTLTAPFSSGVRALLYVDRRMRAEGLDVALTAAAAPR